MNLQVKELAAGGGVSPDTVRHYARYGLLKPKRHPENGYKLFDHGDVTRLRFIRRAKALGFTLKEIKSILTHGGKGLSPCPMVREIFSRRLEENRTRLRRELEWQRRMEDACARWQTMPDGVPDGHSICRLIESFEIGDEDTKPRRRLRKAATS